jgi:hypothetical protein
LRLRVSGDLRFCGSHGDLLEGTVMVGIASAPEP